MNITKKIRLLFSGDVVVMDASTARTIADMQRDLDAYGMVFGNLAGYLGGKFGGRFKPALLKDMAATKEVNEQINMLCDMAFDLRDRYEKLKERYGEGECEEKRG